MGTSSINAKIPLFRGTYVHLFLKMNLFVFSAHLTVLNFSGGKSLMHNTVKQEIALISNIDINIMRAKLVKWLRHQAYKYYETKFGLLIKAPD